MRKKLTAETGKWERIVRAIGCVLQNREGEETCMFWRRRECPPRDPLTLTVVPLLLFLAALGAIGIPARRAAALGPLASRLRVEACATPR